MSPVGTDYFGLFSTLDLASRHTVIAAVSGGSDSTALLLLLKDFLDACAPGVRLVAATVDHGLRAEAAGEAAGVARFCAAHAIAHRTLVWTGPKPATGVPAAARDARHALLAEAAEAEGADLVLTGHTADDQAETVLMRQARDGGRGLAGIAPATLFDGKVWFVRPLLRVRRAALREFLRGRGAGWVDDPTNADPHYERPRLRASLQDPGGSDRVDAALRVAEDTAHAREALGKSAAAWIERHAALVAPGLVRLSPACLAEPDRAASVYALRILLACIGGTPHLPDDVRTAALHARLVTQTAFRDVLSRTLLDARRAGIFLLRETRGLPEPVAAIVGMDWDGRYRISGAAPEARVVAHGRRDARQPKILEKTVPDSLVRAALAAQPSAEDGDGVTFTPLVAPWSRFLPSFDLLPARAAASLLGAPEIPASPFRRHIGRKA